MAEWSCSGLQSRLRRFDSGFSLHIKTMKYKLLNKKDFSSGNFSILPIRYEDRYAIMDWRNEQMYHLRQNKKLTKKEQDAYFNDVLKKNLNEKKPAQILFSYLEREQCIGYGGFVNINWVDKRAEMSFLIDTSLKGNFQRYEKYFSNFIKLLKIVGFEEIGFNRIFTETYSFRKEHIKILEQNAFIYEGTMKEHIFMNQDNKFYDSILHGSIKKYYEK